MAARELIEGAMDIPLSATGFKKKSATWHRDYADVVLIVNLQKSQYSTKFYVNFGIYVKSLGGGGEIKEHLCHVRFRLPAIVSAHNEEVEAVFDLENESLSAHERREAITALIGDVALPVLTELASRERLVEAINSGRLANAMIHRQLREL
ncbi:DUF4304 domain-containing protein [Ciceribacter sp. RN22]|uniref:DUF4304 domain-containing protein n=1 Tax=Ciceribacter sp. RN22 TaxID=2954932 RepID=UPI0020932B45|nr:DUF4304 domain-containing protein [Ciceribacter sp. RN22]MCO6177125.1 DUF4304 domain-containing protein [Ciceribacter sp. RN22]